MRRVETVREPKTLDCASRLGELADPTRLKIVLTLFKGDRAVGALAETLSLEQSLLSHHLRRLREAEIVQVRREGKSRVYGISDEVKARGGAAGIDFGCCRIDFAEGFPTASS